MAVVVGDVDTDVVRVVESVEVADVVGVVIWQFWKLPRAHALIIMLSVCAVASQCVESYSNPPNAQPMSSEFPAGPRNSFTTALIAGAVVLH